MLSRGVKRASREKRRRSGSISAVAEESLSNAMLVQAYNGQDREVERFHRENIGKYEAEMAATRFRGLFTPVLGLIEFVGAVLVLGLGVWELSQGRLTLGGLFAFFAYLARLYGPIQALSNLQGVFFSAAAGAERVIEFLDLEPAIKDRPDAKRLRRTRGVVEFEDVSFAYEGTPANALQRVSLRVAPGETLALVGPSGAGKSTIVKLLLRFYEPDSGRVTVDGKDITGLQVASLRENIAVLLQETLVFDGSVRENISYGRPGATDDEVIAAAEAADAHEFITALPDGYDTVIGEKGRLLSGGQRQRIAIARAMIRNATILVLDEPTTGLDGESGERILEPLRRLMAGRTTIIISHNLRAAREATEILVLEEGRIVERGTYAELALSNGTFARLHGADGNHAPGTVVAPIGNGRKGKGPRSTRLADALRSARRRAA
jgi:ATP-binding cassette, subfamily B, bacterial